MKIKVPFIPGRPVFRNTWKNLQGNIVTRVYETREKAIYSAVTNLSAGYQEVATPVFAEHCLINPRMENFNETV